MNITDDQISSILDDNLVFDYWILQLGIGYVYETAPLTVKYSAPYFKYGKKLWKIFEYDIHELICNKKEPKDWLKELIEGDIRNLIIGITSAITAKYDVGLAIAIPITALIIKTGIKDFCRHKNKKKKREIDLEFIIKHRKIK